MEEVSVHHFHDSLKVGTAGESVIDNYLVSKLGWEVNNVTREQQFMGIDRIVFTPKEMVYSIEYKTEPKALQTGNLFIETFSNIENNLLGWGRKGLAQLICHLCGADLIMHNMLTIKQSLVNEWQYRYETRDVRNPSFTSRGVLVPINEYKKGALLCAKLYTH